MLREVERLDEAELGAMVRGLRTAGAHEVALEWAGLVGPAPRWLAAVGVDRLDVHADALRVASARSLGLPPARVVSLVGALRAADGASCPARVVLRLGRTALADLDREVLDALARAARRPQVELL